MSLLELEREVFSVNDVAIIIGKDRRTVLKLIKNGEIKGFKAAGNWYITKFAIKQFLRIE